MAQLGRLLNPQTNNQQDQWNFNQNIPQNLVPAGLPGCWPDDIDIPPGWLEINQTVSRKKYADLYGAMSQSAAYGPGDGSTTFDLPTVGPDGNAVPSAGWVWMVKT